MGRPGAAEPIPQPLRWAGERARLQVPPTLVHRILAIIDTTIPREACRESGGGNAA